MIKQLHLLLLISLLIGIQQEIRSQQLAFPEAEGFGRYTTGGRGGEVYHVTNLNDDGPGSFRDAVSQPNRIVVFDVGGVINVGDRIVIQKNITVAGQTAPGGGITLYGNGVALNSSSGNSIIRYLRIRMGENGDYRKDALGISDGQNYIFDHVSISWGWDGTVDVNGSNIDNITFQDCIIGQGIDIVGHSTGGLMQSGKWSMIRSLYIDNETRNPKGKGTHEMINNVIYNWGSDGYIMGASDGLSEVNFIGNWFIYGPSSSAGTHITRTTESFHVYAEDNWVDDNTNGILDATPLTDYSTATLMDTPYNYDGMRNLMPANDALQYVIDHAGGSYPARDAVDQYLIDELISYGTKGAIIDRESDNGIPDNVGTVANGTPPVDTDGDGMPDYWEIAFDLDPNEANSDGDANEDGYTNIENYLNWLVAKDRSLPMTILQENEIGFCNVEGNISQQLSDYTGEGYSMAESKSEKGVDWSVNLTEAGNYPVLINYSNGSTAFKNATLIVNGEIIDKELKFASTDKWGTWTIHEIEVPLSPGKNQIRIQANDNNGLPAIDYLAVKGTGFEAASCTGFKPPAINLITPDEHEKIFANYDVEIHAFDADIGIENGDGIEKVLFELINEDQSVTTFESAEAPFIWNLDTETLANDTYTLKVTAFSTEEAGRTIKTKKLLFIVKNNLPVVATQMAENELMTGTVNIEAISYDPDAGTENGEGIESVNFELLQDDNVIESSTLTEAPYNWTIDSETLPNGPLTLRTATISEAAYGSVSQTQDINIYAWNYPEVPPILRLEAEDATVSGGKVLAAHKDYSGTGYVNFKGASPTPPGYIEWTITIPKEQEYTINFGYASKVHDDNLTLSIPDVLETEIAFPATNDWKKREVTGITTLLPEGEHTFKLWSTGIKRAEIDYLEIPDGNYLKPIETPVTTSIVTPSNNSIVTSQTNFEAIANDPDVGDSNGDGVNKVVFELVSDNNVVLTETDNEAPFKLPFNPTDYKNGAYSLRITAHSETGDSATTVSAFNIQDSKPTATIVYPSENQSLTGDNTIITTAFDPDKGNNDGNGIEKLVFEILDNDEIIISAEDSEAPYSYTLATTELENGAYTIRAIATSFPEYGGTSSITEHDVYISNNPPVIDILSPTSNETINGIHSIKLNASDPDIPSYSNNGIESLTINLLKDDMIIDTREFEAPDYIWSLNTLELENGTYTLSVEAVGTQEAGNEQTSAAIDFEIFNQDPEVSFPYLKSDTELQATASIIAQAFDMDEGPNNGDGVKDVEFQLLNGSDVIAQNILSVPPYYWNLQTNNIANGNYTLKAIVSSTQNAGGTSNSTQINVSVSNGTSPASEIMIQENTMAFCSIDGTVDDNNEGFTGDGFSNTDNAIGEGIKWKIEVKEKGLYTFTWRYANGSSARNGDLKINGETLAHNVPLEPTGGWTSWENSSITLTLEAGIYDVSLEAISSGGLANIDYMEVTGQNVISASCIEVPDTEDYLIIQENTEGFCSVEGTIDSDNEGFTSAGFANAENTTGKGIEWSVAIPVDGTYNFSWRYANGSSNRPGKLLINGNEVIANVDFGSTGAWTSWMETSSYDLELTAGTHIIRLEATSSNGLANIDYLMLTGQTLPTAGLCSLNNTSTKFDLNETGVIIEVICFPVPVTDNLNIQLSKPLDQTHSISLFDSMGKFIKTDELSGSKHIMDMSGLTQGAYLLKISGPVISTTKHIVKE